MRLAAAAGHPVLVVTFKLPVPPPILQSGPRILERP
jgi:hypothetical protein